MERVAKAVADGYRSISRGDTASSDKRRALRGAALIPRAMCAALSCPRCCGGLALDILPQK